MRASDARQLLKTYTYYTSDPDSWDQDKHGYQRPADEKRFLKIATDIKNHGATQIVISERGRWNKLLSAPNQSVEMDAENFLTLLGAEAGSDEAVASVIDGQHRLGGANLLVSRDEGDPVIPFLLYTGLKWDKEVDRFNTINTTAKNLPKALVEVNRMAIHDDGATTREGLKQQVRQVVKSLAQDEDSVWFEQVNMTGGRNQDRWVTFEGLRRSTEGMFTGKLSTLTMERKTELAKAYWKAVAETWHHAWDNEPQSYFDEEAGETVQVPVKYRIKDLAAVSALARLGGEILGDAYDPWTQKLDERVIRDLLGHAAELDWVKSKDNPDMWAQAGFAGTADMYQMLLGKIYGNSR